MLTSSRPANADRYPDDDDDGDDDDQLIIMMTMVLLLMMIDRMRYSSRPVNTDRSYKCARRETESSYEKNALDPKI